MSNIKDRIKRDLQAFADDDASVIIEPEGDVILTRGGKDYQFKIIRDAANGQESIKYDGKTMTYRDFLSKEIARLDIFAKKILDKNDKIDAFIDGPSIEKLSGSTNEGKCLSILANECNNFLPFGTKVTFVTADAGHGKTALLKEFQYEQAKRYLAGESNYLFWHVDLQGRDLIRLPEAIMYEVGQMRLQGIYYPSILTLLRNEFLVLAIDGFDELAAEIGGTNAISALSSLVSEMEGQGTLIAASRRTFFDSQDYLKRTKFLKGVLTPDCEFNEVVIKDWTQENAIEYLCYRFDDPDQIYFSILKELHDDSGHPILTRPFLLAKVASGILDANGDPSEFFNNVEEDGEGIKSVVEAFTKREVTKWKERDSQTGNPYLSFEQHITLLSTIAKEMWESKKDTVSIDEIHFYTTLLLDYWNIDTEIKPQIIRMVESHAFLIPVADSKQNLRKFDHDEFRNYFLARGLATIFEQSIQSNNYNSLKKFLYTDQLSDSVAKFCFDYIPDLNSKVGLIISFFRDIINEEWKPTYLQSNIGTLIPFLLNKNISSDKIELDLHVNYSSLIFENKQLANLSFTKGNFINISLRDTTLTDVDFCNCTFNEIKIDVNSKLEFNNVNFKDSEINGLILMRDGEVFDSAYAPTRIQEILKIRNIIFQDSKEQTLFSQPLKVDSDFKKLVIRFLNKFYTTVYQYEKAIKIERKYGPQSELVLSDVIPLLEKFGIIENKETQQTKQTSSTAWILHNHTLEDIFKSDDPNDNSKLGTFWKAVSSYESN